MPRSEMGGGGDLMSWSLLQLPVQPYIKSSAAGGNASHTASNGSGAMLMRSFSLRLHWEEQQLPWWVPCPFPFERPTSTTEKRITNSAAESALLKEAEARGGWEHVRFCIDNWALCGKALPSFCQLPCFFPKFPCNWGSKMFSYALNRNYKDTGLS